MESKCMRKKIYFLIILVEISFLLFHFAKAAPPDSPYLPGETLDPNCSPGETNCTVVPPVLSTRLISTTLPLSGGGDLSEDRILKIPGLSSLGTPNFLVGVNPSGSGWEYKQLLAVPNQISISYSTGSILLSLPQNIHTTASPIFSTLTLNGATSSTILTINQTGTGDIISIQQSGVPIFSIPSSGAVNISAGAASTWKTLAGNLTIQSAGNLTQIFATSSQYTLTQGTTPRFSIDSSGNLSLAGTSITLSGDTLIQGSATTTANFTAQGKVTFKGDLEFKGNRTITGTGTLTINPTGPLYLQSGTYVDDSGNIIQSAGKYLQSEKLQFTGNITIDASSSTATTTIIITNSDGTQVANLQVEGDIEVVGGKITLANGETIDAETADQITINSNGLTIIKSNGAEIVRVSSSGIKITGSATTTGNLIVQGQTQLSTTTIAGKLTISAPTQITGDLTFDTATSTGAFTVQGPFTVSGSGNVSFDTSGTITFGSSTSTPLIFTGYVQSNILPYSDLTYNLGSPSYRWANLYVGTTTIGSTITINSTDITSSEALNLIASATSTWKTLAGNLTIQSAGNLTQNFATSSQYTLSQGTLSRFSIDGSGNLSLAGASISLTGNTLIQGSATTTNNLIVQGQTQLSTTTIAGKLTISAPIQISALTQITGGLTFDTGTSTGAFTVQGPFTVSGSGNVSFDTSGTITFGSSTSTPLIFTGYVQSNILPYSDLTYNLGSPSYRWANLYVATTTIGNTITISSHTLEGSATTTFFTTGNPNQLVLGENGNVGIGTATPTAKLTITQSAAGNIVEFKSSDTSIFTLASADRLKLRDGLLATFGGFNDQVLDDFEDGDISNWSSSDASTIPLSQQLLQPKLMTLLF